MSSNQIVYLNKYNMYMYKYNMYNAYMHNVNIAYVYNITIGIAQHSWMLSAVQKSSQKLLMVSFHIRQVMWHKKLFLQIYVANNEEKEAWS